MSYTLRRVTSTSGGTETEGASNHANRRSASSCQSERSSESVCALPMWERRKNKILLWSWQISKAKIELEVSSGSETKAWKKSENLPDPDVLAQEIVEDLEAALEQFREIAADLNGSGVAKENK